MEDRPYSVLKELLSTVSAVCLKDTGRLILAKHLDIKHAVMSEKKHVRDFRGLAELMGFPHHEIREIEEQGNCTLKIFEKWETRRDAKLDHLIGYLEDMDRHDVIEELLPTIKEMCESYIVLKKSTLKDVRGLEEGSVYDAYVSYADEDENLAEEFVRRLESPRVGLNLFKKGRNAPAWSWDLLTDRFQENNFLKKSCRFVLLLLTSNYVRSRELESLISFAGSLSQSEKRNILIPVILAPCEMPPMLDEVSKIDFSKEYSGEWKELLWNYLIILLLPLSCNISMLLARGKQPKFCCVEYSSSIYMPKSHNFWKSRKNSSDTTCETIDSDKNCDDEELDKLSEKEDLDKSAEAQDSSSTSSEITDSDEDYEEEEYHKISEKFRKFNFRFM